MHQILFYSVFQKVENLHFLMVKLDVNYAKLDRVGTALKISTCPLVFTSRCSLTASEKFELLA